MKCLLRCIVAQNLNIIRKLVIDVKPFALDGFSVLYVFLWTASERFPCTNMSLLCAHIVNRLSGVSLLRKWSMRPTPSNPA